MIAEEWGITSGYVHQLKTLKWRKGAGGEVRWAPRKPMGKLSDENALRVYAERKLYTAPVVASRHGISEGYVRHIWAGIARANLTGARPKGKRPTALKSPERLEAEADIGNESAPADQMLRARSKVALKRLAGRDYAEMKHWLSIEPATVGEQREQKLNLMKLCEKAQVH